MIATSLDANVVLRMILNDVPEQSDRAAEFLDGHKCYLTDVVVSECVFVLEKVYKLDRFFIKGSMEILFEIETLNINERLIEEAFDLYVAHKTLSFADCYSVAEATLRQNELLTFDRAIIKKCSPVAKEPV
jgi:predicted nucleic-acid-binding protein